MLAEQRWPPLCSLSLTRAAHRRLQPVQPDPPRGTVGLHAAGLRAWRWASAAWASGCAGFSAEQKRGV